MAPLNSRYVGRKFFRLAQNAWAANQKLAAMRYINLSIHFDPQNRAAIDLRGDIVADNHFGEHTGVASMPVETPAEALDGDTIAPWVLDDLEQGESPAQPLPHPRDPGVPGRVLNVERTGNFR